MTNTTRGGLSSPHVRTLLDQLDGLPLRARSAWEILSKPEESLATDSESIGGISAQLWNDPAVALNALLANPKTPLELVANRPLWSVATPEARAAIHRLWSNGCAVAHRCEKSATGDGQTVGRQAARIALIRRLGAWALAAVAPDLLCDWLDLADEAARRQWEHEKLGEELAWIGVRCAQKWGLEAAACKCIWLVDEASALSVCDPTVAPLVGVLREAEQWVHSSPLGLFGSSPVHKAMDPSAWRNWLADFHTTIDRDFFQNTNARSEEFLVRENARLMLAVQSQASRQQVGWVVSEMLAVTSAAPRPEFWARSLQDLLTERIPTATYEVVWQNTETGGQREETAREEAPCFRYTLGERGTPLAEIRVWRRGAARPIAFTEPEIQSLSRMATAIDHAEQQHRLLQSVVGAVRDKLRGDGEIDSATLGESLAEFAAGAGHELNNPLAVIMGRAQLLLQRTQDPEAQRSLRVMISQCQRAHRMLRDLMYVARPVERRERLCNPSETLRRCLDDLREEAAARDVGIRTELLAVLPLIETDPEQLRHLLDVLVRNAIEASAAGGEVVIRCEHRDERLIVEVWDQGRGFTREEARYLFVPFFCGRHAGRGLGLGLPRVAHYVSGVGGTLKWSSKPGVGTVFRVTLPARMSVQVSAA